MRDGTRRLVCTLTAALLLVAGGLPAKAQNRFAGSSPSELLGAWKGAAKADRPAIAQALFDNRSATTVALRSAVVGADPDLKQLAAYLLGNLRDPGALRALLAATADADPRVQARAVTALRVIGDPAAAPRLRELIASPPNTSVLKRSVVALGKFGRLADAAVIRPLLSHADETVRVVAAGSLARLGSSEAENVLFAAIDGDNPAAQKDATFALGYLDSKDAATRVEAILSDPDGRWKSYAVMARAQQARRRQSLAEQAAGLESVARGRDRMAATWALEELADLPAPEAAAALERLSARKGFVAAAAQARLAAREGR